MSIGVPKPPDSAFYRPEGVFQSLISPSNLLSRPDIIPSGQAASMPPTPTPPESMFNYKELSEELRAQLVKATDLNDRYYQRIQSLESRTGLLEQLKSERDAAIAELRNVTVELETERNRRELVTQAHRDEQDKGLEVEEQRREIQRLLELGEAYNHRQIRLEREIEGLRVALSEETRQKNLLQVQLNTGKEETMDRSRVLELQSNLEEQRYQCMQLSKQLREQQELNQLLTFKLRESDSLRGENAALVQRLSLTQQQIADLQIKYEKQLKAHYELQVRMRSTQKTHSRPLSCRTSVCTAEKNKEVDTSFEELDRLVATRKMELGLQGKPGKLKGKHWV